MLNTRLTSIPSASKLALAQTYSHDDGIDKMALIQLAVSFFGLTEKMVY